MANIRVTQLFVYTIEDVNITHRLTQMNLRTVAQSVFGTVHQVTAINLRTIIKETGQTKHLVTDLRALTVTKSTTPAHDVHKVNVLALIDDTVPAPSTLRHRYTQTLAIVAGPVGTPTLDRVTQTAIISGVFGVSGVKIRPTQTLSHVGFFGVPFNRHTQTILISAVWPGAIRVSRVHANLSVRRTMLEDCLTTVCFLMQITRKDGVIKRFATFNKNVTWEGNVYKACGGTFMPSEIESTRSMSVDNLEIFGIIEDEDISEVDLYIGKYDYAKVEIFIVDWLNTTSQRHIFKIGTIGEVRFSRNQFVAELRGILHKAQIKVGPLYTATCPYTLFDVNTCKVNPSGFTFTGVAVGTVVNNRIFKTIGLAQATDWFRYGSIVFTTGNNTGLTGEVKKSTNIGGETTIELWEEMPFNIAVADQFTAITGCNKQIDTCDDKFGNHLNFGGFPWIPGTDALLIYPDSNQ